MTTDVLALSHGACPRCHRPATYGEFCGVHVPRHLVDRFVNPLVCVCPDTKADPSRNAGECPDCRRKPLALMGVQS